MEKEIKTGKELNADVNIKEAIFNLLTKKGITFSDIFIRTDGKVVIRDMSTDVEITIGEIQAEFAAIKAEQDLEAMIQTEIRDLAIISLKAKGKIK